MTTAKIISLNRLCVCGCGKRVAHPDNRYILGHHTKRHVIVQKEAERLLSLGKIVADTPKDVVVCKDLQHILLDTYEKAIDKICCIKCSTPEFCDYQKGGSCWE